MSLIRKLKPDRNIAGAVIPLSLLLIFGISSLIFGLLIGIKIVSVMLFLLSSFYLFVYIRTANAPQLVFCADGVFFGILLLVFELNIGMNKVENMGFGAAYISGLVFFGFLLVYLAFTRKLKWRGREIFELAAESVEENGNGYTSRPRPVGKVEYSPSQVRAFARFCARHLIALPYVTSKNISLVPVKMGDEFGRLLGLSGDYRDATWVNFDVNGEVSVHIAKKDYLDYREPLAFDPLCNSLGQLFIDFMEMFTNGDSVRIIDRMNDLNIGILS
jgi:hypothetical protein